MSQYTFSPNDLVFLTGWDRPLKCFFLVVERLKIVDGNVKLPLKIDLVFSNLSLANPAMTLAQVEAVCLQHGTPLPGLIRDELLIDAETNRKPVSRIFDLEANAFESFEP